MANVRGTALFGSSTNFEDELHRSSDKTMYVGELQLGVQYSQCLGGGVMSLYALSEAQAWMAATTSPTSIGFGFADDDVALLGITLGGQFRY